MLLSLSYLLCSRPPHGLLEQNSQKVKHKLLPCIGPFPSQLHSWAALGASIWEGSSDCFTKSCNRLSHWQEHPKLPLSASASHCWAPSCVPATTSWQSRGSFSSEALFCSGQTYTKPGYARGWLQLAGGMRCTDCAPPARTSCLCSPGWGQEREAPFSGTA